MKAFPLSAKSAFRAAPLVLALALVTGCGGGGVDTPLPASEAVAATPPVAGLVEAGGGISGASVVLRDLAPAGASQAAAAASNTAGGFTLDLARVTGPAEAVASGGMLQGQPFAGTLRARLDRRAPGSATPIAINIPTTLVAAVMERQAGLPLAEAEVLVRQVIGLPEGTPLEALGGQFSPFDDAAFMQAAQSAGGFDAYVATVSQKALNREVADFTVAATGRVLAGDAGGLVASDLAGWAGKQFAGQVAGKLINVGLSMALSQAGISLPGSPDAGLAEIKQALDQLRSQIATLGLQMRDMQNELKCSIAEYGYDGTFDGTRQKMMDDIGAYTTQANMLLSLSPSQTATIAAIKAEMNTIASGYQSAHASINAFAMGNGSGGTRGALVNYSAKMKACGPIIGAKKSQALRAHYELMAAQQVMACTMVTNYYNGKDLKVLADAAAASCVTYLDELKKKEINAVIERDALPSGGNTFFVDTRTNRRWHYASFVTPTTSHPINLDYSARRGGLVDGDIYLPGKADLDGFLGDCYNATASTTASCMRGKGMEWSHGAVGYYKDLGSDFHVSPSRNGESRTTTQTSQLQCDYDAQSLGYPYVFPWVNGARAPSFIVGSDGAFHFGSGCRDPKGAHLLLFQNIPAGKRYIN